VEAQGEVIVSLMVRPFRCVDSTYYRKRQVIFSQGTRRDRIGKTQQPRWLTLVLEGSKRRV
jgi:hypothetical protein